VTRGKWVFPICQIGHGKSGSGRAHQVDGLNGSVDCLVFRDVLDRTIVQVMATTTLFSTAQETLDRGLTQRAKYLSLGTQILHRASLDSFQPQLRPA